MIVQTKDLRSWIAMISCICKKLDDLALVFRRWLKPRQFGAEHLPPGYFSFRHYSSIRKGPRRAVLFAFSSLFLL